MDTSTTILFGASVLPLICTPGPDMLLVASQSLSGGARSGLRATAGVCLGYVGHSFLAALGVAAVVAASPALFEALRWLGVAYLLYLACRLVRSALRPGRLALPEAPGAAAIRRGFLTAFLNPKGMMIYVAILPQFMRGDGDVAAQALVLSAVLVGLCALVYAGLSLAVASARRRGGGFGDRGRRRVEGAAGALLALAAGRMAIG
jgi:threonine/homoserine/homoserine lactone efflux protein